MNLLITVQVVCTSQIKGAYKNTMKRVRIIIGIFLFFNFLCLLINYIANEMMIKKYEENEYAENKISVLGFTEPYIAHYNRGNILYKKDNYDEAVKEYEKALYLNPSHDRECKIRINLALAMVVPIDLESITQKNVDEVLETLEKAKNVLYEHGCALSYGNGHNKDAQTLKEEIDKLEEELKNRMDYKSNPDKLKDTDEKKKKGGSVENEQEKKKQLQEIQKKGTEERNTQLPQTEYMDDFDFYDGVTW